VTGGPRSDPGAIQPDPSVIGQASAPPFLRLPNPVALFGRRAARLHALAAGNPLEAYLRQMAALADAQRLAVAALPVEAPPGRDVLAHCRAAGVAPLGRTTLRRGPGWRAALDVLLSRFDASVAPAETREALGTVHAMPEQEIEALADRLLQEQVDAADIAPGWFVAAALQVYWTGLAARLDASALGHGEQVRQCPCCHSAPIASVLRVDGSQQPTRYLHCGLCAAEWHYVRITCAHCSSTKGIAYHAIEGQDGSLRAETCDECGTYTKILDLTRDQTAEPLADDLASIGLDIMVDEAGWSRAAPNPFLLAEAPRSEA
jgi:FdhE protein